MSTGRLWGAVLAWPGTARRHGRRCLALLGKTILLWTAVFAILFGQAGAAFAQTPSQVIFGPFSVKLPTSSLITFSNSFSIPASVTGPYLLRVQLSAPNSLTALSFKLNNVQVLALADFAGGKTLVDRTVTVQTNNSFSLQIAGKVGTVITVTVFATPNLPKPTSLTPNPLNVTLGANGTLTAALSPTPTAAGTLNVSSANAAVATVPASVSFASGQTSVAIPVTTHTVGNAVITATANGGSASATVNVTPAPPTVTSLAPATLMLTQGSSGTLSVTISSAQTTDTSVSLATSAASIASVPLSVIVPAGSVSAPIAVSAVAPGNAQITASLNGASASSQVSVTPAAPTVVSLVPSVSSITRGASTSLTLTISAVQSTDTVVPIALSPPSGIVSASAQVTVLAGQTTALVPISAVAFGQAGVTATLNGSSAAAIINVVAPPVAVTALEPATFALNVGATGSFTVSINAAQPAGTDIALAVDQLLVLQIPASVSITSGQTSAVFTATGLAPGNALITASANGTQKTSSVHVSPQPAAIVSLLPNPLPLQEGATGSLTITINVAQEADTIVALASDAPAVALVAASATIAAGAIATSIPVSALASGGANITASVNGTTTTTAVTVTPPPPVVTSITPATLALPKGTPGTLRVTVSRAPNIATAVTLSSSDPAIASVPASVNIAAGALFADFPVASNAVGQATITASLNGGSATATVTITPAELTALTLSPQTPTIYTGETVQLNATGTMTDGSSQDFTTRVAWTSVDITVATIDAAGLASALAAGTTTIAASFTFTTVIDGSTQTVSTNTVLTVKQLVALVLTAPTNTLVVGNSTTVTATSTDPAPAAGLAVMLTANGSGGASFPVAVSIAAGGTSASFTLTANAAGDVTVTATAFERLPGLITLTLQPALQVSAVSPASGPAGTVVTLTGTGFDTVPANNQIAFAGTNNTTVPATAITATSTQITVAVPAAASSGPISVTNARGTAASPAFTVTPPITLPALSVSVTSPVTGATLGQDTVTVSGTLQGPPNTGVTANGVAAIVTGSNFLAPNVPLQAGANTITVTATSTDGRAVTQSISVNSSGPAPIKIFASPQTGIAPLRVSFSITNTGFSGIAQSTVDFDGSGSVPFFDTGLSISFSYSQPGTYQANFSFTDFDGVVTTQQITIIAQDVAAIDTVLQAAYNGMLAKLKAGDIQGALGFVTGNVYNKYLAVFNALAPNLSSIVDQLGTLQPSFISAEMAEYVVFRTDSTDGSQKGFLIYLLRGSDGVWRIDSM